MADQTPADLDAFLGAKSEPKWRRYAKWALVALGLVLLVWGTMSFFRGDARTEYATVPARQGNLEVTVSATGKLAPTNQVTVGSQLSGLVTEVVVDVNDRVRAGQALALIDPEQLDDQIRQNQANLAAQQAAVQQAQATLTEARATLARFEEVSRLSGGRVPAKTELDTARAAAARGVAGVRTAEANVAAARAQLSASQTQRERAIIRSPVNGVVLARQVDPGQTVAASFNTPTLFVIAEDLSQMELEVAIDEADVGSVKNGQRATFTVDAFPGERFPATISRVDVGSNLSVSEASASSSSTGTTGTTTGQVVSYAAKLSVANAELRLRPGMTATAEIVTTERQNVLLIPNAALRFQPATGGGADASKGGLASQIIPGPRRRRGGGGGGERTATIGRGSQQTVYILGENNEPQPVRVTVGESDGQVTEILSGNLRPGMNIITGQLAGDNARKTGGQLSKKGGSGGGQGRSGGGQRGG
ncbi:efflux transporter periplasmic adaptor subunit [Sphingomonas spermidinifaciens]|uniref:Efflux transporter periplasmic adaptor subunit n=1 Tax=Sphingomonas spermidinifaciens TaxID=1141889 RepID=A0A2A4B9B9_9SPHN|nr:efflux RND transporter periplasmic adaptor subunit [Sphingomonas spermidinifaciens]PCD04379.1 efflux transporter periplasmic adaptor subunit [Sphingomonas spermidinifaciens]